MKYHTQKFRHDPDNDTYGDCFRTCLACLLDLERDDVPHFMVFSNGTPSRKAMDAAIDAADKWLFKNHRLRRLCVLYPAELNTAEVVQAAGIMNKGARFMLVGKSKNGTNHVVICKDGKIEHDPSIDQSGIVSGADPDGYYWVEFLGPEL